MMNPVENNCKVSVALWDEQQGENGGYIVTLLLEVLESGVGQVFLHPADAFTTCPEPEFEQSMQDAWDAARKLVRKEGENLLCDGRWQLMKAEHPVPQVSGRSAGGATARGWHYALMGKVPDEGVIVLAQIDSNGNLGSVDGVPAKTKAIAFEGRFDTIVVASADNQREAVDALRLIGRHGAIRVINVEDVNDGDTGRLGPD